MATVKKDSDMDDNKPPSQNNELSQAKASNDIPCSENNTLNESETQEPLLEEIQGLKNQIATLQIDLDNSKDHMLRALADAENTRKRSIKDREDASKYSISAFAKDLLDFSDNFSRALNSVPEEIQHEDERIAGLFNGLKAMEKEILSTFKKHGIVRLDPINQIFDPHFHEVMFESPSPGKQPGTIIQVLEPGYALNDRLLRPARVGIAKNEDSTGTDSLDPGHNIDQEA